MNIEKSKKINNARLKEMKERNECLQKIREMMLKKLQEERTKNRKRYLKTTKDLILQSMIKLLEPELLILCRKEDGGDIKGMIKGLESEYTSFMKEKTEKDDYVCKLSIIQDANLTEDKDKGCGGVILYTEN